MMRYGDGIKLDNAQPLHPNSPLDPLSYQERGGAMQPVVKV